MTPATLGFLFGVVVGGFSVTLLIGLLFLAKQPEKIENVQNIGVSLDNSSINNLKIKEPRTWGRNPVLR